MVRTHSRSKQESRPSRAGVPSVTRTRSGGSFGTWWDELLVRLTFSSACVAAGYHFHPFGLQPATAAVVGLLFSCAVFLFEIRLRRATLRRLIGAVVGLILGILAGYLAGLVVTRSSIPAGSRSFLDVALLLVMTYIGVAVGAHKGELLNLQALGGLFGKESSSHRQAKIFDTSVIIDGRVADICEAHFLDGPLIVPQFVLRELQQVADSSDALKRQRGRRGLEVLQAIQKMADLEVEIVSDDFPHISDVDLKLVELARRYDAKIVTNDYNLNKVATVQGIDVLNVNHLANALKPVVLPGEMMRVFILRDGKEHNQGVAYLDDGTMVVVEGGRRAINKTVDVTVTSVHQTTAGKMIFGRLDERSEAKHVASTADTSPRVGGETVPERTLRSPLPEPNQS